MVSIGILSNYCTLNFPHREQCSELLLRFLGIWLRSVREINISVINLKQFFHKKITSQVRMVGERGSGAGQGGGGGGAIRDAGGSFGKMEAAHEDQYFYNQDKAKLQKLKEDLHDEISFHEEQIKRHQEAISRHKKRITDMDNH
nr:PREDICTED: ATPase inhibitor mai-2, mitochondrial-like [Megachile rotundata]